MEDHPDQLLPDIMEDPYDMPDLMNDLDDFLPHQCDIPFTRNQHIVNMTHKFKNIGGTKITINIDFKNKQQCFWRSREGDVTTITDGIFLPRADVILEVATVDTFDEEEVALATGVAPRSRSSIEALPSQDIDDGDSSNECTICLNVMQLRDG
ncbi:hypothetical protein AAC387_Pa03g3861 [Persea americana]